MIALVPALLNHLWQSAFCALFFILLAQTCAKNSAAVRYRLWFAASVKFLIPLSLCVSFGEWLGWPYVTPVPAELGVYERRGDPTARLLYPLGGEDAFAAFVAGASPPVPLPVPFVCHAFSQTSICDRFAGDMTILAMFAAPVPEVSSGLAWRVAAIAFFAAWLCGVAWNLLSWLRQWFMFRGVARRASPIAGHPPSPVPWRSSIEVTEPCVFGVFKPVLLLPADLETLPPGQAHAIVLHELAHVRRRDNLTAAFHMAVESLFWFYPPVLWIGSQLIAEREHACDDAAVRALGAPEVYAEAILSVCKRSVMSSLPCVSGVVSANLKERIEAILDPAPRQAFGIRRKALLGAMILTILISPVLIGMSTTAELRALKVAFTNYRVGDFRVSLSDDMTPWYTGRLVSIAGRSRASRDRVISLLMESLDKPDPWIGIPVPVTEANARIPEWITVDLLGQLRAVESVDALIRRLPGVGCAERVGPSLSSEGKALVNIGKPAVPKLIDALRKTSEQERSCRGAQIVAVLSGIGGPEADKVVASWSNREKH